MMDTREPTTARAALPAWRERLAAASADAADFEGRAELVLVVGSDALLLYVSPGWGEIFGEPSSASPGPPVLEAIRADRLTPDDRKALELALASALRGASNVSIPLRYSHGDGSLRCLEGRPYGPRPASENVVLVFHDATERWSAMRNLREREKRFRIVAEATRDVVTETDAGGRFTYVSGSCSEVLGYSPDELVGRRPVRLLHSEDRDAFLEIVRGNDEPSRPFSVPPHRLRRRDGSWVWVEATGVRYRRPDGELCMIGVARDISARLEADRVRSELEEQVRRAQKLESLGMLTGGIAHDFNNLLTPIVGTAGLLMAELAPDSPLRTRVETIALAAQRAAAITSQMLAYAGASGLQLSSIDASAAVREISPLLASSIPKQTRLRYQLDEGLPSIRADGTQIGQVVMNLVANASEALGPDGGCVELKTGTLDADRRLLDSCILGDEREPGRYVTIEIRDDGQGVDRETREKIFDPFFTTKFTGRGLGLAVVLGIVRGHGGAIQMESAPTRGTSFRVLLPIAPDAPRPELQGPRKPVRSELPWPPAGVFLVVDDDAGARELATILLERAGCRVRATADGSEALAVMRAERGEIACVVLDATMPGMSGARVFESIRKIAPEVPILFVSGYTSEIVSRDLLQRGAAGFLQKPFDAEQLTTALWRLLEDGA